MKNPFKKKRYEYFILEAVQGTVNTELEGLYKRGWIVAGDSAIKYFTHPSTGEPRISIPLKRTL